MQAPYQIFKKLSDNRFAWVENVEEFQEARARLAHLSASSEVDYVLPVKRDRRSLPVPCETDRCPDLKRRYWLSGIALIGVIHVLNIDLRPRAGRAVSAGVDTNRFIELLGGDIANCGPDDRCQLLADARIEMGN